MVREHPDILGRVPVELSRAHHRRRHERFGREIRKYDYVNIYQLRTAAREPGCVERRRDGYRAGDA